MAREIVVWCDKHLLIEDRVTGTPHEITLDGRTAELDLCNECWVALAQPLQELLKVSGKPIVKTPRPRGAAAPRRGASPEPEHLPDGRLGCAVPDCDRSFTSLQGVNLHYVRTHGDKSRRAKEEASLLSA